jgi:hypothetical protein
MSSATAASSSATWTPCRWSPPLRTTRRCFFRMLCSSLILGKTFQVNWFRSHRLLPSRLLMLGHLELLPKPAAAHVDAMFSRFPRLGSETATSAGTDIGDSLYSILSFFPRHAQWVGTFGNRVKLCVTCVLLCACLYGCLHLFWLLLMLEALLLHHPSAQQCDRLSPHRLT